MGAIAPTVSLPIRMGAIACDCLKFPLRMGARDERLAWALFTIAHFGGLSFRASLSSRAWSINWGDGVGV